MKGTDIFFTATLLTQYENFENKGISLIYMGNFNHSIIKMFSVITEEESERRGANSKVKKRLNHSVIEILQNLIKHSCPLFNNIDVSKGMFVLGKKNESYYVITANKIHNDDVQPLSDAIDIVNKSTKEELNKMYITQLKNGVISKKGGAGLGLIDIARKTNKPIEYYFLPLDEEKQYFVVKVTIDSDI